LKKKRKKSSSGRRERGGEGVIVSLQGEEGGETSLDTNNTDKREKEKEKLGEKGP